MKIYRRSFGRLFSALLMSGMLAGVLFAGCSDKDSSYTVYNNCHCNDEEESGCCNNNNNVHYQFSCATVAKAIDAGATHVGGFAYDDKGNVDDSFSLAKQEIDKMEKTENGDYLAELNLSDNVKHVELYFYYQNGEEKLATNCKYINVDFASTTKNNDTIIDSEASDASFTIKTYDSSGRETSNFAPGDKIFTKVFLTCKGGGSFFVPFSGSGTVGNNKNFSLVSSDKGVADPSSQTSDDYLLCDALADGTASLYVNNSDFTCLFSDHKINVKNAAPDYAAIYLAPKGYAVSDDSTKILDPNGCEVNAADLPQTQSIVAGASQTFVAIGAKVDGTDTTYTLFDNAADAVLNTDSQNINNDGFEVRVAAGATENDKASTSASYGKLTSNVIDINVEAPTH